MFSIFFLKHANDKITKRKGILLIPVNIVIDFFKRSLKILCNVMNG